MTPFSKEELQRYSRHFVLPQVGMAGQAKLKAASVLLVGAGGLGSPLALYLAAAGVGRIGLVDDDAVDASNLQRQVLHGSAAVGRAKLDSARERLRDLNPCIAVETHETRLTAANARGLIARYDLVADGADNFPTRYLVNDACFLEGKTLVSGSVLGFEGQLSVFNHAGGPCYRCLFPEPPPPGSVPSCAEGGVLGVLPGVIGSLQATEALKLILGVGEPAAGRLLVYNALRLSFTELRFERDPDCPLCGERPTVTELIDYQHFCGLPGEDADESRGEIDPVTLRDQLADHALLDVREPYEREISVIEPSLHIPLDQLRARAAELPQDRPLAVYCRTGVRSKKAVKTLAKLGFNAKNLTGGIHAWIDRVDPHQAKY